MLFFLVVLAVVFGGSLLERRRDRIQRRAFAARLGALYRQRGEFWRVRGQAQESRDRGDEAGAARLTAEAGGHLERITGETTALRRAYPHYANELGWTAGSLDAELLAMGHAVASPGLIECGRWITGRGRRRVEAALHPPVRMEEDALAGRVHGVVGALVGAVGGWVAWMYGYASEGTGLGSLAVHVAAGAALLGFIAWRMKDGLWSGLSRLIRSGWFWPW